MDRRELIINCALLLLIVVCAYLILTMRPERHTIVYTKERLERMTSEIRASSDETQYGERRLDATARHPNFFRQSVFSPLIPTPTPSPTPPPTPEPTPVLEEALGGRWRVSYAFMDGSVGVAGFNDTQNPSEPSFEMRVGGESRRLTWSRWQLDIRLVAIDEANQTATVESYGQLFTVKPPW